MKRTHRCPKCEHPEILFIAEVADETGDHGIQLMRIARVKESIDANSAYVRKVGVLEAGVCRECGYTEFYTREPKSIPVDGKYVQLLTAKPIP